MRAGPVIVRPLAAMTLGLILTGTAGCVRFGAKPPERLLAIATQVQLPSGQALAGPTADALYIEMPGVAKAIATQRVAVREDPTSYAYVQKALWVDLPARQFQALLKETISASGRLVLDPGQYPAQAGHVLHGNLLDFGIDARSRTAIVTYDASLLAADGKTIRRQRFSASRPLPDIEADTVAPAISGAANEVAAAVSAWVKAGS